MTYRDLSDEDKIELAIQFVAIEQPLPEELVKFLQDNKMFDMIVNPGGHSVIRLTSSTLTPSD